MEQEQKGLLGILPRWGDCALWLCMVACVLVLAWWSVPRQTEYMALMLLVTAGLFGVAVVRPVWSQCALIAMLPGIATVSLTVVNPLNAYVWTQVFNRPGQVVAVGVFNQIALFMALSFVLGIWLRAWMRREATPPNRVRMPLLVFAGLSVMSALVSVWRYSDFWPLRNVPYCDQIVNVDGQTALMVLPRILWATVNYVTGPLLFLAIHHVAWYARRANGHAEPAPRWITKFMLVPLLIGSCAPFLVGLYQTKDVWYGAHRVYVWPWLNRINATFYDPNALGSFLILLMPWILATLGVVGSRRRRQWIAIACGMMVAAMPMVLGLLPGADAAMGKLLQAEAKAMPYTVVACVLALVCAAMVDVPGRWAYVAAALAGCSGGMLVRVCVVLALHSGSRTAMAGMGLVLAIVVLLGALVLARRIRPYMSTRWYRLANIGIVCVYLGGAVWMFYEGLPKMKDMLMRNRRTATLPFVKRIEKMQLGDVKKVYNQIMVDRGPYALVAYHMARELPLTGIGLGCFVTELNNWKRKLGMTIYVPDTACNYYLQVTAEQGVIGLIAIGIVFKRWWEQWWNAMQDAQSLGFWVFIGAGMASMLAMFIFGMHTLAHEIGCLFWVFAVQPFVAEAGVPRPWRMPRMVWLVAVIIAGLYVSMSATQLSLAAQRDRFGWAKKEGFYDIEQWKTETGTMRIRHTRQRATDMLTTDGLVFRQTWACLHPDVTSRPVRVRITLGDIVTNVVVADNEWRTWSMPVPWQQFQRPLAFELSTDRTWTGIERGATNDTREIGVTLQMNQSWLPAIGMFDEETWIADKSAMAGKPFRWSSQSGQIIIRGAKKMSIRDAKNYLRLPVLVAHPDVTGTPVVIAFTANGGVVTNLVRRDAGWRQQTLFLHGAGDTNMLGDDLCLGVTVDRTWCPKHYGIDDVRSLGVALGPIEMMDDLGFYQTEQWQSLFNYKWAGQEARWAQRADGVGNLTVQCLVAHPDMTNRPVRLSILVNGVTACTEVVSNALWHPIELQGMPSALNDIEARVDRVWQPRQHGMADDRMLGFAIQF